MYTLNKNKDSKLMSLTERKTRSISRRKLTSCINLYEKFVDEPITCINIVSDTMYYVTTYNNKYMVDIKINVVKKTYPDI